MANLKKKIMQMSRPPPPSSITNTPTSLPPPTLPANIIHMPLTTPNLSLPPPSSSTSNSTSVTISITTTSTSPSIAHNFMLHIPPTPPPGILTHMPPPSPGFFNQIMQQVACNRFAMNAGEVAGQIMGMGELGLRVWRDVRWTIILRWLIIWRI